MSEMICAKGGALTFRDSHGNTPYLRAMQAKNVATFKYLMTQSSASFALNKFGLSSLHYAAKHGALECAQLMPFRLDLHGKANKTSRLTPLHFAAQCGHVEMCAHLVQCGTPVDVPSIRGNTPLHLAAGHGHRAVLLRLLGLGANIEARDSKKRTPLFLAVLCGSAPCVAGLLEAGADPNASSDGEYQPLLYASMRKDFVILRLLAEHARININARDRNNHAALHWAALEGNAEAVKLLLERRADVHARDIENNTAAAVASLQGHTEIAEMLYAHAGEATQL